MTPDPNVVVTADGVRLFTRDWGEGPPVVFLASWSLPSDSWAYQMLALAEQGFRCIAYDRRGHGRSSDPGRGYDFDTLADDLAAVLTARDLRDVMLVGFSMGAGEVVRYLTRHGGERVGRVVLIGATTPFLVRTADNPDGIDPSAFTTFQSESLLRDVPRWIDDNMEPFAPGVSPGLHDWVRDMALRTSAQALLACNRALTTADFRDVLGQVTVPTLVIHGDRDVTSPLDLTGRPTAAAIPGATLVVYEGAPHGLFLTHRDRLNRDLLAFARDRGRPPLAHAGAVSPHERTAGTQTVVRRLLERIGAGDLDGVAALFAPEVEWHLSWPDAALGGPVPWIRPRRTPADVRAHFAALAEHNAPDGEGTTVDRVLVDGNDAVVLGTTRNVLRRLGRAYRADFALRLTVEDGRIRRYHLYEDSLAVARAWGAAAAEAG